MQDLLHGSLQVAKEDVEAELEVEVLEEEEEDLQRTLHFVPPLIRSTVNPALRYV